MIDSQTKYLFKATMDYLFNTPSGILLQRTTNQLDYSVDACRIMDVLDHERGIFLSSGVEYPGRYTRWEIGFIRPPLEIISRDRKVYINALNERGVVMLDAFFEALTSDPAVQVESRSDTRLVLEIPVGSGLFPEEERSLQPSVFTPLRSLFKDFDDIEDSFLGVYGAFGYDLIFQFEEIPRIHEREAFAKDMHLFLPDSIYVIDRRKESVVRLDYVFGRGTRTTANLDNTPFDPITEYPRETTIQAAQVTSSHSMEEFAGMVDSAREYMRVGDVYEVVLHRRFSVDGSFVPSRVWRSMVAQNPSPYEFLCQFGDEQLVGTSPEMFIRVNDGRIESCPISGTIRRGENAMEDADAIQRLLNSEKDEVELTMCTDVDRNDKARICSPGTVKLLSRRLIECYAGLYHTVDHVEGRLRPGMTGIDAFLSHMWAVTLTGSPKPMAVRLIERLESEPRQWYGGAVGGLLFNGDISTGITIRTIHLKGNQGHYRVGATLVYDSKGHEEDQETRTKATVFFRLLNEMSVGVSAEPCASLAHGEPRKASRPRLLLIDNEDSFIHILADYFRQTGAEVTTYRHGLDYARILEMEPDLVVHSPGPGRPEDFGVPGLVRALADSGIPQFGVCLGLQGIVEAFGGRLSLLDQPRQGKRWTISHNSDDLFAGLPSPCHVGAYHALYADDEALPDCLEVLARNETGIIMAVRHRSLPISAVQFHPESILSMEKSVGYRLIANLMLKLGVDPTVVS
jgi:anthranilate synthase